VKKGKGRGTRIDELMGKKRKKSNATDFWHSTAHLLTTQKRKEAFALRRPSRGGRDARKKNSFGRIRGIPDAGKKKKKKKKEA